MTIRFDVNLSILFTELPLLERPAAAKQAGFDAVEFWWPWPVAVPSDADVDRFVAAVTDAGVQLVGLNFFAGDMAGGDRGLVSWPSRSGEFRDNVDVTVGIGQLSVLVPDGVTVQIKTSSTIGSLPTPNGPQITTTHTDVGDGAFSGRDDNGDLGGVSIERTVTVGAGSPQLIVNAKVGVGEIDITQEIP